MSRFEVETAFSYLQAMTLYAFNLLDEMDQQEAIWEGTLLADREDAEHKSLLYQIDCFYVEVFYHKGHNVIRRHRSYSSTEQLLPFLEQLRISPM